MGVSVINIEDANRFISQQLMEKNDIAYSDVNKLSAFDPYIVKEFLEVFGLGGKVLEIPAMYKVIKDIVNYIKNRKTKTEAKQPFDERSKNTDSQIKLWRTAWNNIIVMEGTGKKKPVIEACDTKPLFIIQRGYRLILSNLVIHFNYDSKKLVREYLAPSFIPDDTVEIVRTSLCDETPGLFRVKESIWVGIPEANKNTRKR